jgi:putative membrane protein
MVDDHDREIGRFADKAKGSDSPELREWVSKNLPTLQQHLERAKEIQQQLENSKGK